MSIPLTPTNAAIFIFLMFAISAIIWIAVTQFEPRKEPPPTTALARIPKPKPIRPIRYESRDFRDWYLTSDMRRVRITVHLAAVPSSDFELNGGHYSHFESIVKSTTSRWALGFSDIVELMRPEAYSQLEGLILGERLLGYHVRQVSVVRIEPDWDVRSIDLLMSRRLSELIERRTSALAMAEKLAALEYTPPAPPRHPAAVKMTAELDVDKQIEKELDQWMLENPDAPRVTRRKVKSFKTALLEGEKLE